MMTKTKDQSTKAIKIFKKSNKMKTIILLFTIMFASALTAETKIKVALAGSSACQSYGSTDPKLIYGWGEVLNKYFKPEVAILNFGKSGYGTKWFIDRGNWDKLLESKPDYILMSLGANDSKKSRFTDPKTEFRDNLRRFAADANKINAKIIFVTLNQSMRYDKANNKAIFNKNGEALRSERIPYSQAIREVAKELNQPCLELFNEQRRVMEAMGENKAGTLYRYYLEDGKPGHYGKLDPSHTNLAGAELIAQIIIRELLKSDSPLRNYVDKSKLPDNDLFQK